MSLDTHYELGSIQISCEGIRQNGGKCERCSALRKRVCQARAGPRVLGTRGMFAGDAGSGGKVPFPCSCKQDTDLAYISQVRPENGLVVVIKGKVSEG